LFIALRLYRGAHGPRWRAVFESFLLAVLALCQLLTLSRSGIVATVAGVVVVLAFMPQVLRRPGFWAIGAVGFGLAAIASAVIGINPLLMVERLTTTFAMNDLSSRTHYDAALYAFRLFARFPLTGAGFNNFGFFYGGEVDAHYPNMMAHSAPLSFFCEGGILAGVTFLALTGLVLWRPWKVARNPRLRLEQPEQFAWVVGLIGAMVSLDVANIFYDYYMRTFIWVMSALAIVAARLWERRTGQIQN